MAHLDGTDEVKLDRMTYNHLNIMHLVLYYESNEKFHIKVSISVFHIVYHCLSLCIRMRNTHF